jgi:hypothetical protein
MSLIKNLRPSYPMFIANGDERQGACARRSFID